MAVDSKKLKVSDADKVRQQLDRKILELDEERRRLIESETRFKDFAHASGEWFWESDASHHIKLLDSQSDEAGDFTFSNLTDLANACYSHPSNELLKIVQAQHKFADFVVQTDNATYTRVSAKPVFDTKGVFLGYRGVGRDVSTTISLNSRAEFLATHDELTGLPNRNLFRQRLEESISKVNRSGKQVLLLFFDLDYLKKVNEKLGRQAGDTLLIQSVERIAGCARSTDLLCRIGGDDFVMVMEGASPEDGSRLVREMIAAFEAPFDIDAEQVYCTVSVGVSVYPDDTKDPESLLAYADLAMYKAKQNGRNSFEFYTAELSSRAHKWLDMEQGIHHALKENLFFIVYQPQFDYKTNKLSGLEALLRWRHPEQGLIPPAEFIKVAEQTSLIKQIETFVLDECCAQLRIWLDAGYKVPRLSVNLSLRHLRSPDLSGLISTTAAKHDISPELLCFEISEDALFDQVDEVKQNMQRIKSAGFQISLDHFGMGASSLRDLKEWAVDEVKIDQRFVADMVSNEEDRQIVRAMVALCNALGLNLIGEGVESKEQSDILTDSGCNTMQGYFDSLPLTAVELEKKLKKL